MDDDAGGGVMQQTEGDVVHYEMCPYCEARQLARHGFPSQECPTCDKTGYVPVTTNGTITTLEGEQICPPAPRAVVAISDDRTALVFLVPSKGDEAQWWSICHWDYATDRMEPIYRTLDKGQDAHDVLAWYEGELSQTKNIMRDALHKVLAEKASNGS